MFFIAVMTPLVRAQCAHALRLCGLDPPRALPVGTAMTQLGLCEQDDQPILVHDFLPDTEQSLQWLDSLNDAHSGFGVFALLPNPASPALHALAQHPHRFTCVDIAVASELSVDALARALGDATRSIERDRVARTLASGWAMDPLLTALARRALSHVDNGAPAREFAGHWPTLDQLLSRAGVRRATFVRHAQRAGFQPALRFVHVLRVLTVATALRTGRETITSAAARFGYASTGTLRRHFVEVVGLTPSQARHLSSDELLQRIRSLPT